MNKNESKYFKTAAKMNEAFVALLDKKDFQYITVKEICAAANVNRSTFYLHYENTLDLLQETTRYILDKFLSYFHADVQNISLQFEHCSLNELMFITPEYITPYLTFIQENRRLFKTVLKQFGFLKFEKIYDRMFLHIFDPILSRFNIPEHERSYVIKFYLSGVTAIVLEWINRDCCDPIGSITKIIEDCVMGQRSVNG